MSQQLSDSFVQHFGTIEDPRRQAGLRHQLVEVMFIAICAIIAGADDWVAIERFGQAKESWFQKFLPLKHGIPSHDTFGDVFSVLDPEQFAEAFIGWMQMIATVSGVIALDGKTVRRSFDKALGKAAIHMVSAWSAENRLILGQVKVDDKSNEITALPQLLALLVIKGCLVTIDAMGCQTEIAEQIVAQGGDYLLAVKKNQKYLYEDVAHLFKHAVPENFNAEGFDEARTVDKQHGRLEIRHCQLISEPEWLDYLRSRHNWKGLHSVVKIWTERQVSGKKSCESRYYLCSRAASAADLLAGVRAHWGVENNVHWVLDVVFAEDASRTRTGHGQQNLATMRRIAINMLNQEQSRKESLKGKRQLAGWDETYLERIVFS
ncbi:MAG: ISAs1 family transposase [Anaerolineaceae bacterium]|nr:ISAs1 family transposase [Anaerolineaceae bacterium]